jgi:hypothetical protein
MTLTRKSKSRGKQIRRRQSKRGGMEEEQTSGVKRSREEGEEERNVEQRVEEAFERPEVQQALAVIASEAPSDEMIVVENPANLGEANELTRTNMVERAVNNIELFLALTDDTLNTVRERTISGLNTVAAINYPKICAQVLLPMLSVGALIGIGNSNTVSETFNSAFVVSRGGFNLVWNILSSLVDFGSLSTRSLGEILSAGGRDAANAYRLTSSGINMIASLLIRMIPEGQRQGVLTGLTALTAATVTSCVYDERARNALTGAMNEFMQEARNVNPLQYLTMGHPELIPAAEANMQLQQEVAVQEQALEVQTEEDRLTALNALNTALQQLNDLVNTVAEIKGTTPDEIRQQLNNNFNDNLQRFEEMSNALMRDPETTRLLQQIIARRGEARGATQTDEYSGYTGNTDSFTRRNTLGGYKKKSKKAGKGKRRRRQTQKRRRHRK